MRHIITLSTIPPRFAEVGLTLQSLLCQKSRPEAIELYIPSAYRRFPEWGGGLPNVPAGVTIRRVDEDLGPATKILPAARAWRGQDVELIYVDDDRTYGPDWARRYLRLRRNHPRTALCGVGFCLGERYGYKVPDDRQPSMLSAREAFFTFPYQFARIATQLRSSLGLSGKQPIARFVGRSGYAQIAEGFGGVMVRPEYFEDDALSIPPALWAVDDIWLSGMMARGGISVWADRKLSDVSTETVAGRAHPLFEAVIDGLDRHQANRACIDYFRATYGIWGGVAAQST